MSAKETVLASYPNAFALPLHYSYAILCSISGIGANGIVLTYLAIRHSEPAAWQAAADKLEIREIELGEMNQRETRHV